MITALKSRFLTGGNFGSPKIDLGGCVLYLPLWRPDMIAKGGNITSGTGTMAVTPLNLVVGANTITATGAGTFVITVPQAGTCASGTATITGSPVTLPAGVATTVTTGVTTGTFTVTTSNIIQSKDSIGHLCTITGAVWGGEGRTFDGTDDKVNCGSGSSLDITTAISLEVWRKPTKDVANYDILGKDWTVKRTYRLLYIASGGTPYRTNFYLSADGTTETTLTVSANAALFNTFAHYVATWDGTNMRAYTNGVLVGGPTAFAGPIYSYASAKFYIGTFGDSYFKGDIGETRIYNRALSAGEVMRNYQATQWRYQ